LPAEFLELNIGQRVFTPAGVKLLTLSSLRGLLTTLLFFVVCDSCIDHQCDRVTAEMLSRDRA
jgi:hypothetical protein